MDTKIRKCGHCETEQPIEEFWFYRKGREERQHSCKTCLRKLKKEWVKKMKSTPQGKRKVTIDSLYQNAKGRAKKFGRKFNLTKEYIDSIFAEECPILKTKFILCDGEGRPESPSIDRINNDGDYTIGNVAVISWRANTIKKDGLLEEFKAIKDYIQSSITFCPNEFQISSRSAQEIPQAIQDESASHDCEVS